MKPRITGFRVYRTSLNRNRLRLTSPTSDFITSRGFMILFSAVAISLIVLGIVFPDIFGFVLEYRYTHNPFQ